MALGLATTSRRRCAHVGCGAGTDWRGGISRDEFMARSWHLPQLRAAFSKIGMGADVAAHARAGDRRVDDGADPPGGGVEHKDAVGEDQRLVDAVGDEDHRRAGPRPYGEEVLLQLLTSLSVERAEGVVHEDENGFAHERR